MSKITTTVRSGIGCFIAVPFAAHCGAKGESFSEFSGERILKIG